MITMKQWNDHDEHMLDHINWPASKKEIVEACEGEDVAPDVLEEIKKIPDQEYKTADDLKKVLVKQE